MYLNSQNWILTSNSKDVKNQVSPVFKMFIQTKIIILLIVFMIKLKLQILEQKSIHKQLHKHQIWFYKEDQYSRIFYLHQSYLTIKTIHKSLPMTHTDRTKKQKKRDWVDMYHNLSWYIMLQKICLLPSLLTLGGNFDNFRP